MENTVKAVCQFNDKAGLSNRPFDDKLEASFLIEEALEDFDRLDVLAALLSKNTLGVEVKSSSPKDISRAITAIAMSENCIVSDNKRLDKHVDAYVYTVGAMRKLNLTQQEIEQSILVVNKANLKKKELGGKKDEFGKLMKPEGWEKFDPAPKLQEILDRRKARQG
jgi:predicted HAD superfamily Cof-like phosphohydrolase